MGKKRGRPSKADADTTTNDVTQSADLNGQNSEPAIETAESSAPQPAETAEAEDVSTLKKNKKSKKQKTSDDTTVTANDADTPVGQESATEAADVSTKKKKKREKRDKNNGASEANGDTTVDGQPDAAEGASGDATQEKKKRKKKRKHAEMDEAEANAPAGTVETAADASQADEAAPKKKRKKSKSKSNVDGDAEKTTLNDIVGAPAAAESQAETDGMAVDEATESTEKGEKKRKKSKGDKKEKKEKKSKKKSKEQEQEADAPAGEAQEAEAVTNAAPATEDTLAESAADESPAKQKRAKKDKGKGKQVDNSEVEQSAEATSAAIADEDENFDLPPPLSQPKPKGRKSNVITPIAPGEMSTPVAAAATKRPTRSTKVAPASLFNDLPGHPEASTSTAAATRSSTSKTAPAPKLATQKTGGTVRIGALPDLASAKKTPAPRTAKASAGAKAKGSAKKGPSTPAVDADKVAEMLHVKDGIVPVLPKSLNSEEYQETLATKWLTPKEINALVEEGMRIRSGKYSNEEDAVIKSNINSYRERKDMTEVEVVEAIISKDKAVRKEHTVFWTDLARALHDRPLMSIYHHVTRLLAPTARQGSWSAEEDAKLKAAVEQHGQSWENIAVEVGRWSGDCRDRWRNYISAGDSKATGKWSQAEEDKLRECVRRVKEANETYGNVDAGDTEIFWTSVAKAFGGTRTRHQCRIKWTDNMANKILTKDGDKVRWSKRDAFIFITKLASLGLQREDDIEWGLLPDPDWNWWSGHTLQRRWATLRTQARTALDDPKATFPEMIKYLKEKQDAIPREEVKAFMSVKPGEQGESDGEAEEEQEVTPAPKKAAVGRPKKKTPAATASNARASATKKVLSKEFISESEESGSDDAESD